MKFFNKGEPVANMRSNNAAWMLFAFISLSTVLHIVTLLASYKTAQPTPETRLGNTLISAVLMKKNNQLETSQQKPIPTPKIKKETSKRHVATKTTSTTKTNTNRNKRNKVAPIQLTQDSPKATSTLSPQLPATAISTSTNVSHDRRQQRNYLLGKLQSHLSKHLTYPQRARRRGWQGDVMVALHVNKNGQLNNIHLSKSSGYFLLDKSAISAIAKLVSITIPNHLGPPQAMSLQLPVQYRLQES